MYYNPYSEPSVPTAQQTHSKKYSLRRRYQNPMRQQLDRNKYLRNQEGSFLQTIGREWDGRRVQEGLSFNCMQSAQRILDFNQATSVNLKNHTKTLSTTPSSFENPFINTQPHRENARLHKLSIASSKEELAPSHTKSQKTTISQKASNNSGERLRTENNSQPLSSVNCYGLYEQCSEGEKRGKVSLKNSRKFGTQSKSQLLICLKYSDLKQPIAKDKNSRILPPIYGQSNHQSGIGKYLCSTIKSQAGGCQCSPKCLWMDRWLSNIVQQDLSTQQLPISAQQWEATIRQIQKDLPRTQPEHATFQINEYINSLREVLIGYARLDWEVGYVQGMNFIAAALVYHSRSSFEALKVMEQLMRKFGFRKILLKDLAMSHLVSKRCLYELKRLAFDLYNHFINNDVQMEVFITSWYFSLLGSFVPLNSMHLIIDKFIRSQFTGLNEIIITMLIYLKGTLLSLSDHSLMMAFSNQQITLAASKIDWEQLVARSEHLLLQPLSI